MSFMSSVIVLDDDSVFRKNLTKALTKRGFLAVPASSAKEAVSLAGERTFDAAIIDMRMPETGGLEALGALKEITPSITGVILTGHGSIPDAVRAMKLGCHHYLTKPCELDKLEEVLNAAIPAAAEAEGAVPKGPAEIPPGTVTSEAEPYHGIVGSSPPIRRATSHIRKIKDSDLPVLITGESGTGKELVSRAIHFDGTRRDRPFIAINCASLKPELLENELFGHVKGAFTGATSSKQGLAGAAAGGTLFIDEVADMDLAVQASLLRFIETGVFRAVGSTIETRVNVRVIAALNRDIEEEVRSKRFRLDLYYRLNVCRIDLPPLRERPEDIPLLVSYYLKARTMARALTPGVPPSVLPGVTPGVSPGVITELSRHSWPGNVRELYNVLGRAMLLAGNIEDNEETDTPAKIDAASIRALLKEERASSIRAGVGPVDAVSTISLDDAERRHILETLSSSGWNVSQAARTLGIDRRTLQRKMQRYNLKKTPTPSA